MQSRVCKVKRAHILVVARIANDGASRIIRIFRLCQISGWAARKIARVRIADRTRKRSAKDELFVRAVEITRIIRRLAGDANIECEPPHTIK